MRRVTGIGGIFMTANDPRAPAEGCEVLDGVDDSEYGKFGWVMDPKGNKVELWQPPNEE